VKILIAEDDLISRRLLHKTLEEWGAEVISVENGREAWEVFQKGGIKFVVADWLMPEMDGVSLCTKIRSSEILSGYVYFILLTGKDKKEDIVEGLECGADDYLTKPFDREELRVRLRVGERILNLEKELTEKNSQLIILNKRLEEISLIDPLTEVGNRRHFHQSIEKVHYDVLRYKSIKSQYGLIICDIDSFKLYNDTYGHLEGDKILKIIAQSLVTSLRLSDEIFRVEMKGTKDDPEDGQNSKVETTPPEQSTDIFRFGGEEFVIVLHGQDLEGTRIVAERIRDYIEKLDIENKKTEAGIITISCGISAFNGKDVKNTWESVLNDADKALYQAKASGKNKVCEPS
jgi:PleD family two-component response regulator